jgi:cyclase
VDQQHRFRRRAAGGVQHRRVLHRAAHPGLPRGHQKHPRETDLGRFAGWPDAERLVGNLHRAYAELAGTPRGAPIDVISALADMVTYNGGKPLTCLALSCQGW